MSDVAELKKALRTELRRKRAEHAAALLREKLGERSALAVAARLRSASIAAV